MAYNVSLLDPSYLSSVEPYLGWIYLTNEQWPNPYWSISSYIRSLASDLTASAGYPPAQGGGSSGSISVTTYQMYVGEVYGL